MRTFLLVALTLTAATSTNARETSWRTYINSRYGVSCDYPAELSDRDPPPDNGDGQGFRTPDGKVKLLVFGSYNVDHETPAQLMAERKSVGRTYSYARATKGWFVLSGTKDGQISYLRCSLGRSNVVGCAELAYPAAETGQWAPAIERIGSSLRVGR